MKTLLSLAILFVFSLSAQAGGIEGPELDKNFAIEEEEMQTCTMELTYMSGETLMHKVECDNDIAGKCMKEVSVEGQVELVEDSCRI